VNCGTFTIALRGETALLNATGVRFVLTLSHVLGMAQALWQPYI
jgi:hypothetical protein